MRSSSESSPPAAWPVLDTCSIAALDEDNADSIAWARTAAVVVPGRGTAGAMAAPDGGWGRRLGGRLARRLGRGQRKADGQRLPARAHPGAEHVVPVAPTASDAELDLHGDAQPRLPRNPGEHRHQMMLKRDFASRKPAALTIRKMTCLHVSGSTEP